MERVAFLIDDSGERIDCLLNPETVEVTRLAGVRPRGTASGQLTGAGLADDPLQFTGGGRTELVLDLLFDVELVETKVPPTDVRELTRKLWMLTENSAEERGSIRPPKVSLIWGRTWLVTGVIVAMAERFEMFSVDGSRPSVISVVHTTQVIYRRTAAVTRSDTPRLDHNGSVRG